ncbi:hypothetical protein M8J77_010877 [Diaphorina citri]|nr:hypothetical protein M8J77_010877 [Diaphorina citri]
MIPLEDDQLGTIADPSNASRSTTKTYPSNESRRTTQPGLTCATQPRKVKSKPVIVESSSSSDESYDKVCPNTSMSATQPSLSNTSKTPRPTRFARKPSTCITKPVSQTVHLQLMKQV